jgi:phage terminase large subunit-like protein
LETASAAQASPLSVIISTQAASDADLLSLIIDDALTGADPRTVCKLYTAAVELDPFEHAAIAAANPALAAFQNEAEVMDMAAAAKRLPTRERDYRRFVLNQRLESNTPFIAPSIWKACAAEPKSIQDVPVYGGLDLSSVSDLTALVLIGNVAGTWQVHCRFWLPSEGLAERALADRCPYDAWRDHGYLRTTLGKSVGYEFVAEELRQLFMTHQVEKIGFDRWAFEFFRPWLLKAGFSDERIDRHFVPFVQGAKSMSPALRDLEEALLEGRLAHGGNPLLDMCMNHVAITVNESGDRRLSKKRSTGRIDGAVALVMAVGVAPLKAEPEIDVRALIG